MLTSSVRVLRLLSLLQLRPSWTGSELAERLEVTARTVRRDVARLRDLGYPVDATAGVQGGYQLGAGGTLPPLLLDDDEAVAVVVALRVVASGALRGLEDAAVGALAKLDPVLPGRLRYRVDALEVATAETTRPMPPIDPDVLVVMARGCRGSERVRFTYRGEERTVDPYRVTFKDGRWYLLSRDARIGHWRTFRVDRVTNAELTGHRFAAEEVPESGDLAHDDEAAPVAKVRASAAATRVRAYVPPATGRVEAADDDSSLVTFNAGDPEWLVRFLLRLPFDVEVLEPPDLRANLRAVGERIAATNS